MRPSLPLVAAVLLLGSAAQDPPPLHFVPDADGLVSQFLQVENLARVLASYNRTGLVVYPFASLHFNDSLPKGVSLCSVFALPAGVSCATPSPAEFRQLLESRECVFFGPHKREDFLLVSLSGARVQAVSNFDFATGGCVIGSAWKWNGFRPAPHAEEAAHPIVFQPRYLELLCAALDLLRVPADRLVAVHWRRGDQLYTRCRWTSFADKTVNCRGPEDLVAEVRRRAKRAGAPERSVVFVATNEADAGVLSVLTGAGLTHVHALRAALVARLGPLSNVDAYATDLLLMGAAKVFLPVGRSNANTFVRRLREQGGEDGVARLVDTHCRPTMRIDA